jgi:hypothetical protein
MKHLSLLIILAAAAGAQQPDLLTQPWRARWISVPDSPAFDYGVYHFRRGFDVPSVPAAFPVHVSADNRYVLYLNGEVVGVGPARGDIFHWRYETYDLAKRLRPGRNVLAAVVWNAGADGPIAQVTYQTGFLLAGPGVDTGKEWKCIRNQAYRPVSARDKVRGYWAAGPGDRVDGALYPWGWEQPAFDDRAWDQAKAIGKHGCPPWGEIRKE